MAKIKKKYPAALWIILMIAAFIKLAYLASSRQSPFYEPSLLDPKYYHDWALEILKGNWAGQGVFYGLPLYPFFLALCYKIFGVSVAAVKSVQVIFGLFTIFMIYRIGEKVFDRTVALTACVFAALYGPLFFHETLLTPEALSMPLYAACFYAGLLLWDEATLKRGLLFGLLAGLALLTKAGIALFFILMLIFVALRQARQKGKVAFVFASFAAFLLMILPVTWHNWVYGKDFVPLTSHGGFNFYIGNNEKAEGVFAPPEGTGTNVDSQMQDARTVAETELGRALKPSEVSRYWSMKARKFIHTHPADFIRLTGKKIVLFFDRREISDVEDYQFAGNFSAFLKIPWLNFAVLAPFFFAGSILFLRKSRYALPAFIFITVYIISVAFFFINARYRLPILSVAIVIAAAGIVELMRAVKSRRVAVIALILITMGLGAGVSHANLVGTNWIKSYLNAGDIYLEKKEYEKALKLYRQAIVIDPQSSKAHQAAGAVYTKLGRYEDARAAYLDAIKAEPDNSSPYNDLGLWYDRAGDRSEAERHFLRAIELKPNSSQAHNNLGMTYGKAGELEKALSEFDISLKLNPRSARALTNKGLILYKLGRREEAKLFWQQALDSDPSFEEARKALRLAS